MDHDHEGPAGPPAFHEVRFPTSISRGASGGPERQTEIVVLGSGHEERNSRWAHARRHYNAGLGVRDLDQIYEVISFFEARSGQLHGFRWKDHADFTSQSPLQPPGPEDQVLLPGPDAARYQLVKRYASGPASYLRPIAKPVEGSIVLAVDGTPVSEGVDFTADTATGGISFLPGREPAAGAVVTAGFLFDVPVRFDTHRLEINLAAFEAGEIPDIPIVEIRT